MALSVLTFSIRKTLATASLFEIRYALTLEHQYAIRPTVRNHNTLKRDAVIKQTASMIADRHRVDLTKPDKVVIVEIYQVRKSLPRRHRGPPGS